MPSFRTNQAGVKLYLTAFCKATSVTFLSLLVESQVKVQPASRSIVLSPARGLKGCWIISLSDDGSAWVLRFQKEAVKLFPIASAPCLIEQTYHWPFVAVSVLPDASRTQYPRRLELCSFGVSEPDRPLGFSST
ncbi:hypothetical protein Baya_0903 [Bagarius yarrelli]|uniref:Uncharacterized protein n=1 Tax=Bagarius yarrelli TaxID=175774 RepID=A0A556TJK4_BAGYA|nr:hypothetical protein Baya_0903 [Bagarius yarrelli]